MMLLSTSPKLQRKPLISLAEGRIFIGMKRQEKVTDYQQSSQTYTVLAADPYLNTSPGHSRDVPGIVPMVPLSCPPCTTTPSVVDGKQEILSELSQGFVSVPHSPGLMSSLEPLPDPQSLPETADCRFLQGQFPSQ